MCSFDLSDSPTSFTAITYTWYVDSRSTATSSELAVGSAILVKAVSGSLRHQTWKFFSLLLLSVQLRRTFFGSRVVEPSAVGAAGFTAGAWVSPSAVA